MKFIVCHEMQMQSNPSQIFTEGVSVSQWLSPSAGAKEKIGLRMIGHESFGYLGDARVHVLKTALPKTGLPAGVELLEAIHVLKRNKISLLMLVFNIPNDQSDIVDKLRRPGVATNSKIFQSLGMSPDVTINVYSTCVALGLGKRMDDESLDGLLNVETREKSEFIDEAAYRLVALMIAVERYLLNNASRYLSRRVLRLTQILRLRDQILRWPSLPPIDSTILAKNYNELRDSLHLRDRRTYLLDVLNARAKRQETILSVLGLIVGVLAIVATIVLSR
jgi:hypothetical protein